MRSCIAKRQVFGSSWSDFYGALASRAQEKGSGLLENDQCIDILHNTNIMFGPVLRI
jgi:hypothetical protein